MSNYLISTVAPAASSCFLIASASSFLTPSLTALGAPSTKSLASFKPRPVIPLTSLRTAIFLSAGTEAKITFTSASASSAGAAAAAGLQISEIYGFSCAFLLSLWSFRLFGNVPLGKSRIPHFIFLSIFLQKISSKFQ